MIYNIYSVGGVLCHHGIVGQKWGQRNGPPYPIEKSRKRIIKEKNKAAKLKLKSAKENLKSAKQKTKKVRIEKGINFDSAWDYRRMADGLDPINEREKDIWDSKKEKIQKIENKSSLHKQKASKLESQYHKKMAKVEKDVAKYIKKYGNDSVNKLDTYKLRRAEAKTQKVLSKISKEEKKQEALMRDIIGYHNLMSYYEYDIPDDVRKKYQKGLYGN